MTDGVPSLYGMRRERDPDMPDRVIPTWELKPNHYQLMDTAERADLERRIHAPVIFTPAETKEVRRNRPARAPRKKVHRALWAHALQGIWKRPAR